MGRTGLAALAVAVSLPLVGVPRRVVARTDAGKPSRSAELARSIVVGGKSFDYARALTAMGPRMTGSASYRRAAAWSVDQLHAMGIATVTLEPFTIDRGWERTSARAQVVAPVERALHVESFGWSPSTPEGGLEAELAALETFSLDAIADLRSLRGRIVLLPEGEPPGSSDDAGGAALTFTSALRAAGAVAMLAPDSDPDNELSARGFGVGTVVGGLPAGLIVRDDAQAVRGLLAHGPVRISLELVNRITPGPTSVDNVIADIPGRDRADEWVIVGAHLDSWDLAPGAQDNAAGVATVLEAARAIAALREPPSRSIRFALWGGEEQGQLGSTAYARAHASELDRVVAVLNSDAGTGRIIGWTSPGRTDLVRALRPLIQQVLDGLGAGTFDESLRYAFQSDGAPFVLAGIPLLDLNADDTRYEEIHHKRADTIERVDVHNLAVGAAVVAATAHAIADAPTRVAPRLDRRSIERLRKKGE